MLKPILLFLLSLLFLACDPPEHRIRRSLLKETPDKFNNIWKTRQYAFNPIDSFVQGSTYLAVYSKIYARNEYKTYPLTATVSIRNISTTDSVFLTKSNYYNTRGEVIKSYFANNIYVCPMETVEIIVTEEQEQGGSGANFLFNWRTKNSNSKPIFEAVMISASGNPGISFVTEGIEINK